MKLPALMFALLAIAACTDKETPSAAVTPAEQIVSPSMCPTLTDACSTSAPPSYQTVIAPLIRERCAGCHTGTDGAPWPLDNWSDLAEWSDLVATSIDGCTMPPSDAGVPFTEHERESLRTWVICGSPNN